MVDVRRVNLDGSGDHRLLEEPQGNVIALDYDPVQNKVGDWTRVCAVLKYRNSVAMGLDQYKIQVYCHLLVVSCNSILCACVVGRSACILNTSVTVLLSVFSGVLCQYDSEAD